MPPRAAAPAAAPAPASLVGPPLLTSPEDKRQYRRVVLPNSLVALLVHDPDMTAAAGPGAPGDGAPQGEAGPGNDMMDEDEDEEGEEEGDEGDEAEDDDEMESADGEAQGDAGHDAAPSKKAAIALAVSVGGFSDPEQAQGLSHFLEVRRLAPRERCPCDLGPPADPPAPLLATRPAHGVHGQRGVPGRERV